MLTRTKKVITFVMVIAGLALTLTACNNTQTEASACAYVIQNGYFDAKHVKDIVHPGGRVNTHNTTVREVPCNARNYRFGTNDDADVRNPVPAKAGGTDGTPVLVQETAHFTLNQSDDVLKAFLPVCEKYNCFNESGHNGSSGSDSNYSSAGWKGFLSENLKYAMVNATQQAAHDARTNLWQDSSQWPGFGAAVGSHLKAALKSQIPSAYDFLCGAGGDESKCPDISVTVESVDPLDQSIRDLYNQQVTQTQQQALANAQAKTNKAQLDAAKQKYGAGAGGVLGQLDIIAACKASGATCVITVGGSSSVNVTPGSGK